MHKILIKRYYCKKYACSYSRTSRVGGVQALVHEYYLANSIMIQLLLQSIRNFAYDL